LKDLSLLDAYRRCDQLVVEIYGSIGDDRFGVFSVPSCRDQKPLVVIASNGSGWDHVSVSRTNRCPDWAEMEQVKRLFFKGHETAMQLHVPPVDHINYASTCLHLWRPHAVAIPRPPAGLV
jgi:hypothetical protein